MALEQSKFSPKPFLFLEVKHRFHFSDGIIFEMEFKDIPKEIEKNNRFQWYLIFRDKRYTLSFDSFKDMIRYLSCDEMKLVLDIPGRTLTIATTDGEMKYALKKAELLRF